jgi:hypothetical protein
MRHLPRNALVSLLCGLAAACGQDVPDLVNTPWKSLEVEYCTSKGETRVWRSTQAAELDQLRASMAPATPRGLTMILTSYTNEIRLVLASGQRWNLYYRDRPTDVTLYDPDSIKRSFTVRISEALYSKLSSALIASGGESISLKGDCRIPSMVHK